MNLYTYTDNMNTLVDSVYDFHKRFGLEPWDIPYTDDEYLSKLRERLALLMEELGEVAKDLNRGNVMDGVAEVADVAFVALGILYSTGSLGGGAAKAVALKNDAKTHTTHYFDRQTGKIIKRRSD